MKIKNGQVIWEDKKKPISKNGIIAIIVIALILIAGIILGVYYYNNNYVFKVNGEKVYVKEFEMYFEQQKKGMEEEFGSDKVWENPIDGVPAIEHAKNQVKDTLIAQKVKLQKAKAMGIKLTAEEQKGIEQMFSRQTMKEMVAESGMTVEEYKKIWEEYTIMQKLTEQMETEVQLSNEEIEEVIKNDPARTYSYNVRHILFKTQNTDGSEMTEEEKKAIKQKADSVLARIQAGEDFATLAKEYSEDSGSKGNGGLYENKHSGEFVTEFDMVMTAMLKPGEVMSVPIKTEYGYHIIKLEAKNPLNEAEMSELRNEIADELRHKKVEEGTEIKGLIDNAKIEMNEKIYNEMK